MKILITIIAIMYASVVFSQEPIADKTKMCEFLREMASTDQLYRKGAILGGAFGTKSSYSKKEIDSVWALQIKIDNANTEKLIELTKQYGWLSEERVACSKLDIWLIFRHSQQQYFGTISELIDSELSSGRLSDWHYKLINNHLKGRPKD